MNQIRKIKLAHDGSYFNAPKDYPDEGNKVQAKIEGLMNDINSRYNGWKKFKNLGDLELLGSACQKLLNVIREYSGDFDK